MPIVQRRSSPVKGSVVLTALDGVVASLLGATPLDGAADVLVEELDDELEELLSFEGAAPDLGVSAAGGVVVVGGAGGGVAVLVVGGGAGVL
jgi:hypothetical protein